MEDPRKKSKTKRQMWEELADRLNAESSKISGKRSEASGCKGIQTRSVMTCKSFYTYSLKQRKQTLVFFFFNNTNFTLTPYTFSFGRRILKEEALQYHPGVMYVRFQ